MYTCMRRYNPYLSDSSEGSEDEDDEDDELRQLNVRHTHPHTLSIFKPTFFCFQQSPFEGSEDGFRELDSNSDSVDGESFRESSRKSGSSQKVCEYVFVCVHSWHCTCTLYPQIINTESSFHGWR